MSSLDFMVHEGQVAASAAAAAATPLGLLPVLAAGAVWYVEFRARSQAAVAVPGTVGVAGGLDDCKRLLRCCAPEATGLVCCAALAVLLLFLREDSSAPEDPADLEAWSRIKEAWPLLTTADTLIALQAMLRLPPLVSAALRRGGSASAVDVAPSAAALGAAVARAALLWLSPYHRLDGPLGGGFHMAFEVAAVPLLLVLASGLARRPRCALALAATGAAAWAAATRHRLALADDNATLDALFTFAELLELTAAAAFLLRTLARGGGPQGAASSLMHVVLPLQQGLSMYYFLLAFQDDAGLAGAGQPLALLQLSSTLQVFFYLAAAAVHIAVCIEGPES